MDKIVAPLNPDSPAAVIANLQSALQLCFQRKAILANDDRGRQQAAASLAQDQLSGKYGSATAKIVSIFQDEHRLQGSGRVDEATAVSLNKLLQELGAFDQSSTTAAEFVVSGRVQRPDNTPAANRSVRALHEDHGNVVKLGADTTDSEGLYTIRYRPIAAAGTTHLNVVVLDESGARIAQSGAHPAGPFEVRDLAMPADAAAMYRVTGKVHTSTNAGLNGLNVDIVDKGVGGDAVLASATTDPNGSYEASFATAQVKARNKSRPDLQARVSANGKPLGVSNVHYNASVREVLDVLLDEIAASALRSEHEALTAALGAEFNGKLGNLKETDQQKDLTYLANKTGWDARAVALASLADQFSAQSQNSVEQPYFYALFRAGLPANAQTLYRTDAATLRRVWTQASDQGVIPKASTDAIDTAAKRFQEAGAKQLLAGDVLVGVSSLASMLEMAGLDADNREKFAVSYAANRADPQKLWQEVGGALGDATAKRLQAFGKLGFLTINNASLMRKVGATAGGAIVDDPKTLTVQLAQNGFYRSDAWTPLLTADVLLPSEIPGANDEARRGNYAKYLAAQVRLSEPTASVARMVKSGEIPLTRAGAATDAVHKFLSERQSDFDIGSHPIRQYLADNKLTLDEGATKDVQRLQRVYQLTPNDAAMAGLLKRGVDAAHHIVRHDRNAFIADFAPDLGGEAAAATTHDRAVQVHNAVLNVVVSYLHARTAVPVGVHSPPAGIDPVPTNTSDIIAGATLEKLFGSMDFCACSHCRSILSPAAYLVDLLMFLDNLNPPVGTQNPQDVLLKRRPDIQHLPLTCDNTNTALPYIDLVNETLEYFIANTAQKLSLTDFHGHDTGQAASEDLLASPQYVMDMAYTTLQGETFPPTLPFHQPLEHLRRLFVKFDVSLPRAMEVLRTDDSIERANDASYGWRDIWMEELGLSRDEYAILTDSGKVTLQAMYGFPGSTAEAVARARLANAKGLARRLDLTYYDLLGVLRTRFVNPTARLLSRLEKLGVSFAVMKALKDKSITDAAFDALLGTATTTPDPAEFGGDIKAWIRNNGNYADIMSLVTLAVPAGIWTTGQAHTVGDLVWPKAPSLGSTIYFECTTPGMSAGAEPAWTTLVGTTVSDGQVVWTAHDAADCSSFEHLALRYADPTQIGSDVSAADYIRLLRFVRLWKKLGWTIEQTDATLCALFTEDRASFGRTDCDTPAKLDTGFLRLLPRLGQLRRVMGRLSLTVKRDLLPMLACFAPMTTFESAQWAADENEGHKRTAQPSLYRQLFLNPALLAQDKVFADSGYGEFLAPPPPAPLSMFAPHAEAIRTACSLTRDEYDYIVAALAFDATTALTVANISAIYRRGWLARKLKMSVRELLLLAQLTGLDPFAADTAAQPALLRVIDLVQAMRARSLSVTAAAYLIWNQDLSGRSEPAPEQIAALARTLRLSLAGIETALAVTDDPDGSAVQDRLSLVYGNDAATLFLGLLNGTVSSATTYADEEGIFAAGGAGPAIALAAGNTDAGTPRITYDDFGRQLTFSGVLTPSIAAALKAATGGGFPKFDAAVDQLLIVNTAVSQPLFDRYSELKTAYDMYVADHASSPAQKRSVLLKTLLPELIGRRKRQQALQIVSAGAGTDPSLAPALLDAPATPYPLHANAKPTQPALDDVLAVQAGGLSVRFFASTTASGATIAMPDLAPVLDYAKATDAPLPPNAGAVISGIWSGYLEAPETGMFNLHIEADIGATVKLAFHGTDVLLNQTGTLRVNASPLALQAGSLYRIELTVESVKDTLRMQWEWRPKGQGRTVVPTRYLYPATPYTAFKLAYVRFLKAASLAVGLDLTSSELCWFATNKAYRIDGTGKLDPGGDDWLNVLPSTDTLKFTGSDAAVAKKLNASLLAPLAALLDFSRVKAELADRNESLLRVLQDPVAATKASDGGLYAVTRWSAGAFSDMLARFTSPITTLDFEMFKRVYDAMGLAQTIGAPVTALIQVTTNEPTSDQVRALQSALRARYDDAAWRDLIKPINDGLRVAQRDALVAYILQRMPTGIDTPDKLFEYFLMDVKMEPCMQTSRIRHALSSVQIFIERCLMNLEKNVAPAALNAKQWAWMKRYRVWEANRKVYLFPENWLEPELRDDKSPFFKEIESELLQSDITDERAEIAMLNYLSKLEEVAKLEPCGIHYVPGDPLKGTTDLSHVVARTTGAHRKYFYRRQEYGYWTPWEQIKLDIEDNPVIPVVWNERLFVFWVRVLKQSPEASSQGMSGVSNGSGASDKPLVEMKLTEVKAVAKQDASTSSKVSYRVVLCWSENFNGKWQATRTSDVANPIKLLDDFLGSFDRTQLKLSALFWTRGALRMIVSYAGSGVSFLLHNAHSLPEPRNLKKEPHFTPKRTLELSTDELRVAYTESNVTSVVLKNSLTDIGVQPNHPVDGSAWHLPFLYQDARHAFYVTTDEELVWVRDWSGFGVDPTPKKFLPFIPPVVMVPPRIIPDPVNPVIRQPRFGVVDPSPIEHFITEDAYIARGLGTPGTVHFGEVDIGPAGSIAPSIRTR